MKKQDIWLFFEHDGGRLAGTAFELINAGRRLSSKLGVPVVGVLLGSGTSAAATDLSGYGLDALYVVENKELNFYRSDVYSQVMADLVKQHEPGILLFSATASGVDLAATLGVKLETGVLGHCLNIDVEESGMLVGKVPVFGQGWLASVVCPERRPQIATLSIGFIGKAEKDAAKKTRIEKIPVKKLAPSKIEILETLPDEVKTSKLETADVVVTGGYGIGGKDGWQMIEQLASELGGTVGATRPPCDEHWAVPEQMIGQSGKRVRPGLYIGIGVSGATHHLVGIQDSRVIVTINSDPKAPIIKASDYAIVADYRQVVPVLLEKLKHLGRG